MGFAKPNPLVAITGKIGELYIAKQGNKYIVKHMPERKEAPPTDAQKPGQQKLTEANFYWREVKAQPALEAVYVLAAKARGQRACDLAKSDFMNAPVVTDIDLSRYIGEPGGIIRVAAKDDLEVATMWVRILELDGTVVEEGEATLEHETGRWMYAAKVALPAGRAVMIEVTATDRPGHKTAKRIDHICGPR